MTRGPGRASDSDRSNRWQTVAWLVGPLAVVLILAFLVFQPSLDLFASTPSATLTPVPLPTATPFPSPELSPVTAASVQVRAVPFAPGALVNDLAVAGTRLIAVGAKNDQPAAWYSDDGGETWAGADVAADPPPRKGAKIALQSVAAFESTLAAVGQWQQANGDIFGAGIWTSVDSGAHWSEVPRDAVPRNIYTLDSGGFGFLTSSGDARLVVSTDAVSWDDLPYSPILNGVYATGFASRGDQVVLMADRLDESAGAMLTPPVFWVYRAGSGWTTVDRDADEGGPANLRTLVADASGYYAGGLVYTSGDDPQSSRAALWRSADGTSWHRLLLSGDAGLAAFRIAHGSLGTLVLGGELGVLPATMWLVPDGDEPAIQEYRMGWDILSLIGFGDRFVAFAQCGLETESGCDGSQVLMISASEAPYEPPSSVVP